MSTSHTYLFKTFFTAIQPVNKKFCFFGPVLVPFPENGIKKNVVAMKIAFLFVENC